MRHLYNSRVEVEELAGDFINGTPSYTWAKLGLVIDASLGVPGEMLCRLDMTFQRPGKDQPQPIVAGRAPDRIGLLFYDYSDAIKAGHRLRVIAGPLIGGVFELRAIPDVAQAYSAGHHMEVQVMEVAQNLAGTFPASDLETGL
jgi:hypothetical protein